MTGHVTATRPPPHGHNHPRPSHVPGHVPGHVISHVPGCVCTFDHGNLPRALGPRALSAALGPLALPATPFPLAHGHSFLVANTLRQPWPMAAFVSRRPLSLGGPRPLAAFNLRRPLAYGAPLATIGYQGVVVIRNGRVIEPIVRGGGHGGLGGMSWWCGGMSWKVVREKGKGLWGIVRSRCHGLTYLPREGVTR